jgi:hypothetical protein
VTVGLQEAEKSTKNKVETVLLDTLYKLRMGRGRNNIGNQSVIHPVYYLLIQLLHIKM